jgi:signal transduction histidine kinase
MKEITFNINPHGFIPLICGITMFILGIFVLSKNPKSKINFSYSFLCFVSSVWMLFYSFAYFLNKDGVIEFYLFKIGYSGVIFIPIGWAQFLIYFLELEREKRIIPILYGIGFIFIFLLWQTDYFMSGLYKYFWGYYPKVCFITHPLFLLFYSFIWMFGMLRLWQRGKREESLIKRNHIRYVAFSLIVVILGLGDFLPNYGIKFYPLAPIWAATSITFFTYAIFRYRLLDINIAITRLGVVGIVYTLILGIPFWIGFRILGKGLWILPISIMAVFASAAPFIYMYFQRKTEDSMLKEQRKEQQFLMQASTGMATIRELKKLLGLIIHLVSKTLKVNNAAIYLLEAGSNQYVLKASRFKYKNSPSINMDDPLIKWLKQDSSPLVYEEIKMRADMEPNSSHLKEIASQMKDLSASVIVPCVMQDTLLGFLILGERKTQRMYTTDLLNALGVMANQAALAIENAIFYEETGKTLAQQFNESRLRSLGQLSGGVAHQVFNILDIISLGGGFILEMLQTNELKSLTPEELDKFKDKLIKNVKKILAGVQRGAEVTEAIKNYAKADKAPTTPSVVSFKKIVANSKELALLKHRQDKLEFQLIEDYPEDVMLWVNLSTVQDAILNAIDNSCDAMLSKRNLIEAGTLDIKDYKPQIIIRGRRNKAMFEFQIEDNGIGMTEEQLKYGIGTPLFTTKGKGTGLGFSMMRQFIKQNKGDIRVESQHHKWTKVIISLPLATKEQIEQSKEKTNENNNR